MIIAYPTNKEIENLVVIINDEQLIKNSNQLKGNDKADGLAWRDGIFIMPKNALLPPDIECNKLMFLRGLHHKSIIQTTVDSFILGRSNKSNNYNTLQRQAFRHALARSTDDIILIPVPKTTKIKTRSGVVSINLEGKDISVEYNKGQTTLIR